MTRTHLRTVRIAGQHTPRLSKGQKAFNALIKQIENRRVRLSAWEKAIPPYQKKYADELVPLVEASLEMQVEMVHCLDRASAQKGLTKTERRMITDLITELAGELVSESDEAELKAIYNKHSRSDYDKKEAANMMGLKSMLEEVLGFDLGDDTDNSSPEDIMQRAQERMQAMQMQYDAERQVRDERQAKRKKSAKQLAREVQQQAEEQQISLSIREVYRKLASALHPDRETDPQERIRKNTLMQRVNQAYDKKNLLQLLELQLELEHIDQHAINNISEDRLQHYNKILKEQLGELDQEIFHVEEGFKAQFGLSPFTDISPGSIMRGLARDIAGAQTAIGDLEKDLLVFEDIKTLKAWLREMRRQSRMDEFDDCPF